MCSAFRQSRILPDNPRPAMESIFSWNCNVLQYYRFPINLEALQKLMPRLALPVGMAMSTTRGAKSVLTSNVAKGIHSAIKAETMVAYWLTYFNIPVSAADEFCEITPLMFLYSVGMQRCV